VRNARALDIDLGVPFRAAEAQAKAGLPHDDILLQLREVRAPWRHHGPLSGGQQLPGSHRRPSCTRRRPGLRALCWSLAGPLLARPLAGR
jgi:hypothetical protein